MRLPIGHAPPPDDAPPARCRYLENLAAAAVGLPLGPAAELLSTARSRGRHGNALQWHFGLSAHDSEAQLDWEGRIEIKLVTVWRRGPKIACDKLKVCAIDVNPWRKLSNVLFVFADALTKVVVGHRFFNLAGSSRVHLARSWAQDPHFERPDLFVESRGGPGKSDPAYYLAASWLGHEGLLPEADVRGIHVPLARTQQGTGTRVTVIDTDATGSVQCPRCGAPIAFDPTQIAATGWAAARHGLPLGPLCGAYHHVVIPRRAVVEPLALTHSEAIAGMEGRPSYGEIWRLVDRVSEPEDHGH